MRAPAVSLVALALALSVTAPAVADKAPSASQRESLANEFSAPARCLTLRVSTANGSYASGRFNFKSGKSCQRYGSDGITIFRRSGGGWEQRYAGSDCMKPSTKRVPSKVWRDLSRSFCGG